MSSPTPAPTLDRDARKALRRELRGRRRSLDAYRRRQAASRLFRQLKRHPWFVRSKRIAFYLASRREGEIDPAPLLAHALRLGKRCYLPALRRDGPLRLVFVRYRARDRLRRSRFGLREPAIVSHRSISPAALGLVLVPLVGFDARGNRMGMGKGYYDRSFAFKRARLRSRPLLLGLAHECQKVEALPAASWDVPLDGVATPERLYYPPGKGLRGRLG